MKGRKPDPKAPKRGTARHRKSTELAPVEYSDAITPRQAVDIPSPRTLPRTKAVKWLWYTMLNEIARHELRQGDLPLIEATCIAKFRHTQAGLDIKKHGMMISYEAVYDPETQLCIQASCRKLNPMVRVERDEGILYDRLSQRLGLSPESRIRLDLMQVAGATMLSALRREMESYVADGVADAEIIDGEVVIEDDG